MYTDDYSLQLLNSDGVRIGGSAAQNQVAALGFVGALARLASAREWIERKGEGTPAEGTVFPIVVDSPFGQLDREVTHEVGANFAALAPQLIVFVSDKQGDDQLQNAIWSKVGSVAFVRFEGRRDHKMQIVNESREAELRVATPPGEREAASIVEVRHG